MGEWEGEFCADCGALVRESPFTVPTLSKGRTKMTAHFYIVGPPSNRRKVCAACFVTTRVAPMRAFSAPVRRIPIG